MQVGPTRGGHFLPFAVAVQAPFEHPFRLFFLGGQESDDFLAQPGGQGFGVHRGGETGLVVGANQFVQFSLAHRSGPDVEYQSNLVRYYTPFVSAVDHRPYRGGLSTGSRWRQGGRPVAGRQRYHNSPCLRIIRRFQRGGCGSCVRKVAGLPLLCLGELVLGSRGPFNVNSGVN